MDREVRTAQVRVRLLHRRTYRSWIDPQAKFEGDLLLAERTHALQR
jgi:hypothetical protein